MTTDETRARKLRWIALLAAILIALPLVLWINARGTREVQRSVAREESPRAEPTKLERAGLLELSAREADTPAVSAASDGGADAEPQARVLALRLRAQTEGAPLAGVRVHLVEFARQQPFLAVASELTDELGEARFADVAPGLVRAHALGVLAKQLDYDPNASEAELVLMSVRSVDCLVRGEDGAAARGASVWLAYDGLPHESLGETADDGRLTIVCIALRARLYATAPGLRASATLAVSATSDELEFVLARAHGGLRGVVHDASGAALEGVRVEARARPVQLAHAARWARSDGNGRFELDGLTPGEHQVVAALAGYAAHTAEARIEAGETSELVLELTRGAQVRGRILDAHGEPAGGVSVNIGRFGDWSKPSTTSAADGSYELAQVVPGAVTIVADSERHGRAQATLELVEGMNQVWNPRLDNGRALRGTLMNAAREPLANWIVARVDRESPTAWHWKTKTAADGSFELGRSPPGSFSVAFGGPQSSAGPYVAEFDPGPERVEVIVPWEWIPASQLVFTLRRPDGALAVGATCNAHYADRRQGVACRIQRVGDSMRIEGLRAGELDLQFESDGCGPLLVRDLVLGPRETRQLGPLQFEQGAWLRVEHVDEQGMPLHWSGELTRADLPQAALGEFPRLGTRWSVQGHELEFGPLAPGAYLLLTPQGSNENWETRLSLVAGQQKRIRIAPLQLRAAPK
jgi:hypothetical protein